jgi:hypothetical protein
MFGEREATMLYITTDNWMYLQLSGQRKTSTVNER